MAWKKRRNPFSDYYLQRKPAGGYWLWVPFDCRAIPPPVLYVLCLLERNGTLSRTEIMFWHKIP